MSHQRRHDSSNIYKLRNAFCFYGIILTLKYSLFKHKQELCHHVYNKPEQLKKIALRVTLNKIIITTTLLNIRVHPRRGHEGPEGEWRYNPTLSLTSALDEGGQSTPHPGRFTPRNDLILIVQEAGWAPRLDWTGSENLAPTGIQYLYHPACSKSLY